MRRFLRLYVTASFSVGGLVAPAAVLGAPGEDGGYVVDPGDSLFGIARRQGVPVGDLLGANGLTLTSVIHPGQQLVVPTGAASSSATNTSTYTVQSGDSLFGIARRQGVPVGDLLGANGLTLTSVIHPGQQLVVPTGAASSSATNTSTYTVQSGDSLFGIARRQGVPVGDLLGANGLTLTSVIHPGQQLVVPTGAASSSANTSTYTVQSGDSLFGIARRQGVPVGDLLGANGLTLTSVIHPGQQLVVPAGASPAPSTSSRSTPSTTPPPTAAPRPITSPPTTVSPTPASAEVVERIIRDVWPDALEETALTIAWRESHYESGAQSQCCSGLFQIYYEVHKFWLADLGINSRDDLYHPRTNAEAAFALYQRAGGWGPWSLAGD